MSKENQELGVGKAKPDTASADDANLAAFLASDRVLSEIFSPVPTPSTGNKKESEEDGNLSDFLALPGRSFEAFSPTTPDLRSGVQSGAASPQLPSVPYISSPDGAKEDPIPWDDVQSPKNSGITEEKSMESMETTKDRSSYKNKQTLSKLIISSPGVMWQPLQQLSPTSFSDEITNALSQLTAKSKDSDFEEYVQKNISKEKFSEIKAEIQQKFNLTGDLTQSNLVIFQKLLKAINAQLMVLTMT